MFRCGLQKDESLERSAHAALMALENALRALYAVPLSKPLAPEQWNAPVVRATARGRQNLGGAPAPQPAVGAARGIDACHALEENGRILASLFAGRWHGQGRAGCVPPFEPAAPWVALGIAGCGHHRQASEAAAPSRRGLAGMQTASCPVAMVINQWQPKRVSDPWAGRPRAKAIRQADDRSLPAPAGRSASPSAPCRRAKW